MTSPTPTTEQVRGAWDALAPRFDAFTTAGWTLPFGEQVLRRVDLGPGTRFLDVACGTGALALPAARRGADVVAVDIAPTMIALLRDRADAEGLSRVDGRVMAGETLDLPDASFDVSASLNGVSLFPDVARGLAEMARVTRPGGRVLVAAFGAPARAEFLTVLLDAMQAVVPGFALLTMDPPPRPFQLADPARLRQELAHCGLGDVHVETVAWDMVHSSASRYWDAVTSSHPIAAQLTRDLSGDQRSEVVRVLDGMFRERSGGAPGAVLRTEMNVGIATA